MDMLSDWVKTAAEKYSTTIVVITGMDWQNVFSPWPAKGVPKGTPDFKGQSPEFLNTLNNVVIPKVESSLGLNSEVVRSLVGVSMSGLFALWQWPLCDTFVNIASMSGSFWYEGFLDWFKQHDFSEKTGKAFFLLGDQETQAKAFSTVGVNTQEIVNTLRQEGVNVTFKSVSGNHYANPIQRLDESFGELYGG